MDAESISTTKTFSQDVTTYTLSTSVGPSSAIVQSKNPKHPAVADTGSTGHYLSVNAPHKNKRPATSPVVVALPDHTTMKSTHVVDLPLPGLPPPACEAHLFPALGNTSLISIGQLCDHGCSANFNKESVIIELHGKEILRGHRSSTTNGLWVLELPSQPVTKSAFATHPINQSTTAADMVTFGHASLFSPRESTLHKALQLNYVHIPGLTAESLKRHPPKSRATIMGHLDQQRQNLASTKTKDSIAPELDQSDPAGTEVLDDVDDDYNPEPTLDGQRTHVCFLSVEAFTGQVFSDQTGRFPVPSSSGNNYLMVVYDYDSNLIDAEPMPSKTKHQILAAYKRVHAKLVAAGLRPRFHRLDNEASDVLKQFMHDEGEDVQKVPPGQHRRNAAERGIRTFKNHFIAGLSTTHPDFPLYLWDKLLPQALLSLNLLRGSRINPKLSAWAQVYGHFDFNRTPIGPPGTHVIAHEKPDLRKSWATHGQDAWYIGPAVDSYRCYSVWIWNTRAERVCDTVEWMKSTVPIPTVDVAAQITASISDITKALKTQPGSLFFNDSQKQTMQAFFQVLGLSVPPDSGATDYTDRPATSKVQVDVEDSTPGDRSVATAPPDAAIAKGTKKVTVQSATPPSSTTTAAVPRVDVPTQLTQPANTENKPSRPSILRPSRYTATEPLSESTNSFMPDAFDDGTRANNKAALKPPTSMPSANPSAEAPATLPRVPVQPESVDVPATLPRVQAQPDSADPPQSAEEEWTTVKRRRRSRRPKQQSTAKARRSQQKARRSPRQRQPNPKYANNATRAPSESKTNKGIFVGDPVAMAAAVKDAIESTAEPDPFSFLPFCGKAVHPDTGDLCEYKDLANSSEGPLWERSACIEFGRLAQGWKHVKGTDTIHFIHHNEVPVDRKATYVRYVTTYRPQKEEPRRVRMVVGGDKVDYPGVTSTKVADMTTAKILFNSVLSTPGAKFMGIDVKDFYLNTALDRYEYIRIPVHMIPQAIMDWYNLHDKVHNGYVYAEVHKGMYGFKQAGKIANDELIAHLDQYGYAPCVHTPGLWKHESKPTKFTLVVDDFGVQYSTRADAEHLSMALQARYPVTEDWEGERYTGITLKWDYKARTVDLSLPGYVEAVLRRLEHPTPTRKQRSPHQYNKPVYGRSEPQLAVQEDTSERLDLAATKRIQEGVGALLFYARAVDNTMLVALSTIASKQANATKDTAKAMVQLLNYAATYPNAVVRFHASGMILHLESDASYLSEPKARSCYGGYFYLSDTPVEDVEPPINGPILVNASILKTVMASASEAETGGLFHNCQDAVPLRTTLDELGWKQPPTPVNTDNKIAMGIATDTVKQRRSRAIDMRFYWVRDRVKQNQFRIHWRPGKTNLGDYFTKHHSPSHHQEVRPIYLHEPHRDSVRGCVDHTGVTEPAGATSESQRELSRQRETSRQRGRFSVDDTIAK